MQHQAPQSLPRTLRVAAERGAVKTHQGLSRMIAGVLKFHQAAWDATSEPIIAFLNEPDATKQDQLTSAWKDTMHSQLVAVLMTSALVGSVVAGGCAWPQLADSQDWKVSTILGLWYSSLLAAVTATSAATQQIVALTRLGSHPDGLKRIRYMLCLGSQDANGKLLMSRWQSVLWQGPVSLLNTSLVLFIAGLCGVVYLGVPRTGPEIKIVAMYSVVAAFAGVNYLISSAGLWYWIGKASKATI